MHGMRCTVISDWWDNFKELTEQPRTELKESDELIRDHQLGRVWCPKFVVCQGLVTRLTGTIG